MRIALISDIHGNSLALEAALADIRRQAVDQLVCLGDAIQGGPQPAETIAALRSLNCPLVLGNADDWLLTGEDPNSQEPTTRQQQAVRLWSLSQLSPADLDFIKSFQPLVRQDLGGGQVLVCFHGSPRSYNDLIFPETPEEEFRALLGAHQSFFCAGGHTHLQQIRRLDETFFFNPGSVGAAHDRYYPGRQTRANPWIEYALLTARGEQISLEFRRLPLDLERYLQILKASGRPYAQDAAQMFGRSIL